MKLLTVKQLTKKFADQYAVHQISFELSKGKCVALLGPNGAGKTTTLKMLSGLAKPSSGTIQFGEGMIGTDIRKHIGYLPQHPVFYDWMTGYEYLNYVGKLSGLTKEEVETRGKELLQLVGIYDAKDKRIGNYSGGMKQRLGIAQALIHQPRLVMLDEPVSALDPLGRREVLELIKQLKEHTTVLFSTHILNDAEEVSDELILMNKGEIIRSGSLDQLLKGYENNEMKIVFEDYAEKYISFFKELEFVSNVHVDKNNMKLVLNNLKENKFNILSVITKHQLPIEKIDTEKMTLEDLFMKEVK